MPNTHRASSHDKPICDLACVSTGVTSAAGHGVCAYKRQYTPVGLVGVCSFRRWIVVLLYYIPWYLVVHSAVRFSRNLSVCRGDVDVMRAIVGGYVLTRQAQR